MSLLDKEEVCNAMTWLEMSSLLGLPAMTQPNEVSKTAGEAGVPTLQLCIIICRPLQEESLLGQVCRTLDWTLEKRLSRVGCYM